MSRISTNTVRDSCYEEQDKVKLEHTEEIFELEGRMDKQDDEDKLMSSVMDNDKDTIEDGRLITETINQGQGSFQPDMMFKNIVNNFSLAKQLYGETMLRELTGYDPEYIEKNLPVPEFRKELENGINEKIRSLKEDGMIDKEGVITEKGYRLSSLILYVEELDNLIPKGFGDRKEKKKSVYGDKEDCGSYKKARYRDIAIRQSVKTAVRRKHENISKEDLKVFERKKKGRYEIIYALDSSGSMRGDKIRTAKKAGVALAYKAIQEKNKVGLIVFGSKIKKEIMPTDDFMLLLSELAKIRAAMETDIAMMLAKAVEMFSKKNMTKHLIILSDALPTKGNNPEKETLTAASLARSSGITISMVGIDFDDDGLRLARGITEIGGGRLYSCKNLEEIDKVILGDYYMLENSGPR